MKSKIYGLAACLLCSLTIALGWLWVRSSSWRQSYGFQVDAIGRETYTAGVFVQGKVALGFRTLPQRYRPPGTPSMTKAFVYIEPVPPGQTFEKESPTMCLLPISVTPWDSLGSGCQAVASGEFSPFPCGAPSY